MTTNFAVGWSLFGVRASLIPLFVIEGLRRDAVWIGIGFAISAIAQALTLLPAGRFVDSVGRRPAMIFGGTLAAVSMLLLALMVRRRLVVSMRCSGSVRVPYGTRGRVGDVSRAAAGPSGSLPDASDLVAHRADSSGCSSLYSYSAAWLTTAAVRRLQRWPPLALETRRRNLHLRSLVLVAVMR